MNYEKLISNNPSTLGEFTNSIGQLITFVEHPFRGDEFPVIAVCHELGLASATDFFDLDDLTADHREYEPSFVDGKLWIGDFLA